VKLKTKSLLTILFISAFTLLPVLNADVEAAKAAWVKGSEIPVTGHSFNEEYWTNSSVVVEGEDTTTLFAVNYINSSGVQVFMVAANMHQEQVNSSYTQNGTLPFQFFGMHYTTPNGTEVFVAAVFAFLYAWLDNYNGTHKDDKGQGLPDPGNETFYYIFPFGVSVDQDYQPETEVHPVVKSGEGNYTFGITYRNLYAKVLDGKNNASLLLSLLFPIPLLIIKFSEFTVTYHVEIDNATGQVRVETFYDIGQITQLYVLGSETRPSSILNNDTWGIGAAHYVSVFTGKYNFTGQDSGKEITETGTDVATENVTMKVGDDNERALDINLRGTYDLVNETTDTTVCFKQDPQTYYLFRYSCRLLCVSLEYLLIATVKHCSLPIPVLTIWSLMVIAASIPAGCGTVYSLSHGMDCV